MDTQRKFDIEQEDTSSRAVADLMVSVGGKVREVRRGKKMSRRELSERSSVSHRYLVQLETGEGNISIGLLMRIAIALEKPIEYLISTKSDFTQQTAGFSDLYLAADPATRAQVLRLLDPQRHRALKEGRVCLIGLRGAGKSTLGSLAAKELGAPFLELTALIEETAGMPTGEVMALYGQEGYREIEASVLNDLIAKKSGFILAAAGGIVGDDTVFQTLLNRFHTIWLKASSSEHMERVRAQGDLRPMKGNPQAMMQLKQILRNREAQYQKADYALDTSNKALEISKFELLSLINENRLLAT